MKKFKGKMAFKKGIKSQVPVSYASNPIYSAGRDQENCGSSQPRQIVHKILSRKYLTLNKTGRVGKVVEHRPSKHETLSSTLLKKRISKT
jgi:hypothetical protein